jgi:hypothetical protein
MFVTDFYEIAMGAETEIGVDMHLDVIFSDDLNKYFNYKYDYVEDIITLTFEVDGGSASLDIIDAQSPSYSYRMNNVLSKYIEESVESAC